MKQNEMFGSAVWVCGGRFPVLKGQFQVSCKSDSGSMKATLRALGLGFFHCYINGIEVSKDHFLPLSTDYESRTNYPPEEKLTGHRIYVPEYDITSLIKEGENSILILFGGGWYTFEDAKFGDAKAIYRILLETENGIQEFVSSGKDRIADSFINDYYMPQYENHDYRIFDDSILTTESADWDEKCDIWKPVRIAEPLETEYLFSDCPADRVAETLRAARVGTECSETGDNITIYDCGKNITGWPVLHMKAGAGEKVTVFFSEELDDTGNISAEHGYRQRMEIISDGRERMVRPMLTWFGFRYFSVEGNAEPDGVERVHTDIKITSSLDSDNENLNWLYQAYINTQLGNMHAGIPSDCPHIERRGYTGDGQLACSAAMTMLDAKEFYRKWIYDIADCQDELSGHVQYTAPYTRCGGGPGGWGCAIVEVPYQFWLHYGETKPLADLYPQMLRYFDYLEAHSCNELVISDKEGEWCLGDWCPPIQVVLPAPFVNNYFYIKSLGRMIDIARILGKEADIPFLEERIGRKKEAVMAAYFNTWDGNFIGNLQGANAFAVDIGLGDERTYRNLVDYYKKTDQYDTGIFGTDIVTRVLFEHGDGEVAANLLMSEGSVSFAEMKRRGATTIWELWPDSMWDRSHNHPMFGAAVLYIFEYLLGIRQEKGAAGFEKVVISPVLTGKLEYLSGSRSVPAGEIHVSYVKKDDSVEFKIVIPTGVSAEFILGNRKQQLKNGENIICI